MRYASRLLSGVLRFLLSGWVCPRSELQKGTALNRIKQHFFKKIWKEVLFVLENYPYLLDFKQVQEILRIGRNQLLFRLQSGEIPAFKVGRKWRVRKNELLRYMEEGEQTVLDE